MLNFISTLKDKSRKSVALGLVMALGFNLNVSEVSAGDYVDDLFLQYNGSIYKYRHRLITLEIDDMIVETGDMPAVLVNGDTTMVPVREVFESEAIGADVFWKGETQEVYINYLDQFIVLKIDSKTAYVNNAPVELSVPAMLIQDMSRQYPKTMLPLRFVSEKLGFEVDWDAETFTAQIDTGKGLLANNGATTDPEVSDGDEDDSTDPVDDDGSTDEGGGGSSAVEDANDSDAEANPPVVSGEQLDRLEGTKANRSLPTPLNDEPIVFEAVRDDSEAADPGLGESEIQPLELLETEVVDVDYEEEDDSQGFSIRTSGPMSDVGTHIWDGKYIVEIYNSTLDVDSQILEFEDNEIVTSIRMGDHHEDGRSYSKSYLTCVRVDTSSTCPWIKTVRRCMWRPSGTPSMKWSWVRMARVISSTSPVSMQPTCMLSV